MNENKDKPPFVLSDSLYPKVKWLIIIVIPALGTLYFALAKIWALPAGEQILGTLIAVQAFLGAIFAVSTSQYNNSDIRYSGSLDIHETPTKDKFLLNLDEHPETLKNKDEVVLKVQNK